MANAQPSEAHDGGGAALSPHAAIVKVTINHQRNAFI
jgi:hypothetical protein